MSVKEFRSLLDRKRGQQEQTQKLLSETEANLERNKSDYDDHLKAREIIREVGLKTQQALALHISDITTLALKSIFSDPYELKVDFVTRRNKTECDLLFLRDGEAIDPIEASGGGAVDVAAFALRVASWSMRNPRSTPVIVLDEPMKFLSKDLQNLASETIKEISLRLGVQFLIITHEEELSQKADALFKVTIKNKKSKIL